MKTTVVTIAAMFLVAWALNKSVAPAPDNLLMMNVEALASGPDGGGGGGNEDSPGERPKTYKCYKMFTTETSWRKYRWCTNLTGPEGPQRSGGSYLCRTYQKNKPLESSEGICTEASVPSDPQ